MHSWLITSPDTSLWTPLCCSFKTYDSCSPGYYPHLTVNCETFPAQKTISTLNAVYSCRVSHKIILIIKQC